MLTWLRNSIMRDEVLFYVLEGAMVLYPAFLLSIFSPGLFFPEMGSASVTHENEKHENSDEGAVMVQ